MSTAELELTARSYAHLHHYRQHHAEVIQAYIAAHESRDAEVDELIEQADAERIDAERLASAAERLLSVLPINTATLEAKTHAEGALEARQKRIEGQMSSGGG